MPIHFHHPRLGAANGARLSRRALLTVVCVVLGLHLLVLAEVAAAAPTSKTTAAQRQTAKKPATPVKKKVSKAPEVLGYTLPLDSKDWQKAWNFFVPKEKSFLKPEEGLDLLVEKDFSRVEWLADGTKFPGFLRVKIPKDSRSNFAAHFYQKPRAGVIGVALGDIKPAEEMTLTYYVRFPKDFDFSISGALPCLGGGYSGSDVLSSSNVRTCFYWGEKGQVIAGGNYKESTDGAYAASSLSFKADDEWHKLEISMRMNTFPSRRMNGVVKAFYDGQEVLRRESVQLRTRQTDKIDAVNLNVAIGGLSPTIAVKKDMYVDLAGFSVKATTLP